MMQYLVLNIVNDAIVPLPNAPIKNGIVIILSHLMNCEVN